jgi:hypothetical protein
MGWPMFGSILVSLSHQYETRIDKMLRSTSSLGCIDKSSSAELSEAINSMYRWYKTSAICYAYLSDCRWNPESIKAPTDADIEYASLLCSRYEDSKMWWEDRDNPILKTHSQVAAIRKCMNGCRWFSRGWTLQELIAPLKLNFFDQHWHFIAKKTVSVTFWKK